MHGLIHIVLKSLVEERFGHDSWQAICSELGIDDDSQILQLKQYDDAISVAGVVATAKVLGVGAADALKLFGEHFIRFIAADYMRMLKSMGDTLQQFLINMNHLHYSLERTFRDSTFPYLEVTNLKTNEGGAVSFTLSYSSVRKDLLAPVIEGALPMFGKMVFKQDIAMMRDATPVMGCDVSWTVDTKALDANTVGADVEQHGQQKIGDFVTLHSTLVAMFSCCPCPSQTLDVAVDLVKAEPATTVSLDQMVRLSLPQAVQIELDDLQQLVKQSNEPAALLMRGTPASEVTADWGLAEQLAQAAQFWNSNVGAAIDYSRSKPTDVATRFVSHSWSPPSNWQDIMGSDCCYGEVKATQLKLFAQDIAQKEGCQWTEVLFWIDKCCIPQRHPLMETCVGLIEEFIKRCQGITVMFTWEYFTRLWCVYEWASFLVFIDPTDVDICVDVFMRPASQKLLVESVAGFSLDKAQCYRESDRAILMAKVREYYHSERAFEDFARGTAVALLALAGCRKASRGETEHEDNFTSWVELADRLGYSKLASALRTADPRGWRSIAQGEGGSIGKSLGSGSRVWQQHFSELMEAWFLREVMPVLKELKTTAVRPEVERLSTEVKEERMDKLISIRSQSSAAAAAAAAATEACTPRQSCSELANDADAINVLPDPLKHSTPQVSQDLLRIMGRVTESQPRRGRSVSKGIFGQVVRRGRRLPVD